MVGEGLLYIAMDGSKKTYMSSEVKFFLQLAGWVLLLFLFYKGLQVAIEFS